MNILTAIETRKSIRGYLDKPVPKETVQEILETALRSPSATNIQPWNIYAVTGEVLDKIKQESEELFLAGVNPSMEDDGYPEGIFKQRRKELAMDLFALLDIKREDKDKRKAWTARGQRYFDAPVALIFTINKEISEGSWSYLGIGSITQSVCLAAMEYGLGTCISGQGVSYHSVLKKHLGISEEEVIVISVTMGYPDPNATADLLVSKRAPLSEVAKWAGF